MSATSKQNEEHVAGLEAKLSELSEVTGNYERLRYQDQLSLQKLRERISQLDVENSALAKVTHRGRAVLGDSAFEAEPLGTDEEGMEMQEMIDKIMRMKGLLKVANEKLEKPVNIDGGLYNR